MDRDVRTIDAIGEPVRRGTFVRRRRDLRIVHQVSPQLLRSRHGRTIGAGLHAASVLEKVAQVGGHRDQGADGDQGDGGHCQDLASLTVPLLAFTTSHAPIPSAVQYVHIKPG